MLRDYQHAAFLEERYRASFAADDEPQPPHIDRTDRTMGALASLLDWFGHDRISEPLRVKLAARFADRHDAEIAVEQLGEEYVDDPEAALCWLVGAVEAERRAMRLHDAKRAVVRFIMGVMA